MTINFLADVLPKLQDEFDGRRNWKMTWINLGIFLRTRLSFRLRHLGKYAKLKWIF